MVISETYTSYSNEYTYIPVKNKMYMYANHLAITMYFEMFISFNHLVQDIPLIKRTKNV